MYLYIYVYTYIHIYIYIYIGSTLAKIDNCPLRFKAYKLSQIFVDIPELVNMLAHRYIYVYIHIMGIYYT
jgi:hypothetical protein